MSTVEITHTVASKENEEKKETLQHAEKEVGLEEKEAPKVVVEEKKAAETKQPVVVEENKEEVVVQAAKVVEEKKPEPVKEEPKNIVTVLATGYTAGYESTQKKKGQKGYGVTKSGVMVHRGTYSTVAADTDVFPIGTILNIPGYGYGVVADTGSAINGYKIDLYYNTVEQVYNEWGKKHVDVEVLKWGSGSLSQQEFNQLNGG